MLVRMDGPVLLVCQETVTHSARKEGKREDATGEKSFEHCFKREVEQVIPLHIHPKIPFCTESTPLFLQFSK